MKSSDPRFLDVAKTAGLLKDEGCGVQTQRIEMASADKPQTMNLLVTGGCLQCVVQWGGHL